MPWSSQAALTCSPRPAPRTNPAACWMLPSLETNTKINFISWNERHRIMDTSQCLSGIFLTVFLRWEAAPWRLISVAQMGSSYTVCHLWSEAAPSIGADIWLCSFTMTSFPSMSQCPMGCISWPRAQTVSRFLPPGSNDTAVLTRQEQHRRKKLLHSIHKKYEMSVYCSPDYWHLSS